MKKMICFTLSLLMLCCMFTGCTPEDTAASAQPRNVACVVTIANNNPRVDADMINELSELPGLPGSTYVVINAEGQPRVICEGEIPDFVDRGYSKAMLERIQSSIAADINGQIETAVPCTPQVDIASAISRAVRNLHVNAVDGRENLLVLYTSGISSSGLIDMVAVPVYQMDVDASVSALTDLLNLDMAGIDVVFYACGDVAGAQSALSREEETKLKDFYEKLFLGMGADSVTFMEDIPGGNCYNFDQTVAVMQTQDISTGLTASVVNYQGLDTADNPFKDGDILSFDDQLISFFPDATELADPEVARAALDYVIRYMQNHPDFELLICGTTTSAGEEASCMALSEGRARTIQDLLVSEGVSPAKVHVVGCGYSSVLYIPDRLPGGALNEAVAPQNRSVKLVNYNSETATQILASLTTS